MSYAAGNNIIIGPREVLLTFQFQFLVVPHIGGAKLGQRALDLLPTFLSVFSAIFRGGWISISVSPQRRESKDC